MTAAIVNDGVLPSVTAIMGIVDEYKQWIEKDERGEEKGMFEFGGSTVVLLLKKDAAVIDSDILENSAAGAETRVRIGEVIGRKA